MAASALRPRPMRRADPLGYDRHHRPSSSRTAMNSAPSTSEHVLVARDGPIVTLTFNRPEARNAMTWEMYQRLYEVCEEVDADDAVRVLVLKGAGGKAFVAGTDISQFTKFKSAEDGLNYEKD